MKKPEKPIKPEKPYPTYWMRTTGIQCREDIPVEEEDEVEVEVEPLNWDNASSAEQRLVFGLSPSTRGKTRPKLRLPITVKTFQAFADYYDIDLDKIDLVPHRQGLQMEGYHIPTPEEIEMAEADFRQATADFSRKEADYVLATAAYQAELKAYYLWKAEQ